MCLFIHDLSVLLEALQSFLFMFYCIVLFMLFTDIYFKYAPEYILYTVPVYSRVIYFPNYYFFPTKNIYTSWVHDSAILHLVIFPIKSMVWNCRILLFVLFLRRFSKWLFFTSYSKKSILILKHKLCGSIQNTKSQCRKWTTLLASFFSRVAAASTDVLLINNGKALLPWSLWFQFQ